MKIKYTETVYNEKEVEVDLPLYSKFDYTKLDIGFSKGKDYQHIDYKKITEEKIYRIKKVVENGFTEYSLEVIDYDPDEPLKYGDCVYGSDVDKGRISESEWEAVKVAFLDFVNKNLK